MNLIAKIKANRLKAASSFAIGGDIFMGMAGGEGLIQQETHSVSYSLLMLSGSLALLGHLILFAWGKGAQDESITKGTAKAELPIYIKPFFPRRYPLDAALFIWLAAGISYTVAGLLISDMALIFMGATNMAACLVGWLMPKNKTFFGFNGMQMTSLLYFCSTAGTFWSAWSLGSTFIFFAACAFSACNAILYTVNKEHQSAFTQQHES